MKGIMNVSPVTVLLARLITVIIHLDRNNNGKVDRAEWLGIIQFMLIEGYPAMSLINIREIKEEIKDLDTAEIAELVNVFSMNFDLKDDELEALIEEALMLLANTASFIERLGNWKRSKQDGGIKLAPVERLVLGDKLRQLASS